MRNPLKILSTSSLPEAPGTLVDQTVGQLFSGSSFLQAAKQQMHINNAGKCFFNGINIRRVTMGRFVLPT